MRITRHNLAGRCGAGIALVMIGCSTAPKEVEFTGPVYGSRVIAVAPAMNLSGSTEFDPLKLADWMASELGQMEGIKVIGVNRVLAVLSALNQEGGTDRVAPISIRDPAHALRVVQVLGADEILVFAVTEYDPYDPPTVGFSAQLYGFSAVTPAPEPEAGDRVTSPALVGMGPKDALLPKAQVQRVFRASSDEVAREVKSYGEKRDARKSAYGWRRYLVSQEDYVRYCCHAVLKDLLSGWEYPRAVADGGGPKDKEGMP